MSDYLKILSSGDSSVLNLKRAGIGFAYYHKPQEALVFLLKAHEKDTADIEVLSALGQNYMIINELKNSARYYRSIIKLLTPVIPQLGLNYLLLAEVLKSDNRGTLKQLRHILKARNSELITEYI